MQGSVVRLEAEGVNTGKISDSLCRAKMAASEDRTVTKPLKPLRTEADYQAALVEYEAYFDSEPEAGSEDGDHFKRLGAALALYESSSRQHSGGGENA